MNAFEHVPVLGKEVCHAFNFGRPVLVVDGTLGLGGHSELLLQRYPDMRILGLEWDTDALATAQKRLAPFGERFEGVEANYADVRSVLSQRGRGMIDGILLDLGLSSRQLADSSRGFSFLKPGPLDMRMSRSHTVTAWHLLTHSSEQELAGIFRQFGEEPMARPIAHAIKDRLRRGMLPNDAWQVAEVIRQAGSAGGKRIDPATRCFQALRIVVNQELSHLDRILSELKDLLAPQGRAAIISFHSLEDRRVKTAFVQAAKGCVCPPQVPQCVCGQAPWARLLNRKVIVASEEEMRENPRARSAKFRVLEKL